MGKLPLMLRNLLRLSALPCAVAACGTDAPDPQGTYHVTISEMTSDSFPSAIQWPVASDLTLVIDTAGFAKLTFLDSPARVEDQDKDPDGSLRIRMYTGFPIEVLDLEACPRASVLSNDFGTSFELQFRDGHVHGTSITVGGCIFSNDDVTATFVFDLSGDRAPR